MPSDHTKNVAMSNIDQVLNEDYIHSPKIFYTIQKYINNAIEDESLFVDIYKSI